MLKNGKILANLVAGQDVHRKYGGVVPELASRAHQKNIIPVVDVALREAHVRKEDLHAIAFTRGPGLLGSLLVGVSFAKALALGLGIPLIEVNHMQAHVLAHFIEEPFPAFPFLCLTVSGGHTQIVQVNAPHAMQVLGETTDDAAGEAFDKAAKILGLPYPGGPLIDQYAKTGNPFRFKFPLPQIPGLDYSYSGIKTAFLYFVREQVQQDPDFIGKNLPDICASIQQGIIQHLMQKLEKASQQTGIRDIAIAGGVSANSALRKAITESGSRLGWRTFIPRLEYCTDNAAMIAAAAYFKYQQADFSAQDVSPFARFSDF